MTEAELDVAYTMLCRTMTELGEANATLFLARLSMLAIARLNDAAAATHYLTHVGYYRLSGYALPFQIGGVAC